MAQTPQHDKLLIVDFAPHKLEQLREEHQHRRLGFGDEEIGAWLNDAGLTIEPTIALAPDSDGLTVTIWSAVRAAADTSRKNAA